MPPVVVNKDAVKKGGRRNFVRTRIPAVERRISIFIVILLALIGTAIAIKGRYYDPGLYSLRNEALNSTRHTVAGKASTARSGESSSGPAESSGMAETEAPAAAPSAEAAPTESGYDAHAATAAPKNSAAAKGAELDLNIPGLKAQGKTEFYNPDNLFEKIDGRAPAYLGYNFQQLRSRSFTITGAANSYVDVYEYRMDTPVNAFGIFAVERDPKGGTVNFAPDGYAGEMGYFFRQGVCYVQIIASDQKPKTMELALAAARDMAKLLKQDNTGIDAVRHLPATGQIPGTINFVQENALGQVFFKNVFQASYDFDGAKLPFFIMACNPAEAAAAWKSYFDFSSRFGKASLLPGTGGAKVFEAQSFGKWRVIYQRTGDVGGVYDATDGGKAREFVLKYLRGELK